MFDKGISFLKSQQLSDGSFVSLTSADPNFSHAKKSETIFPTALIVSCLNSLETTPEVLEIKKKAVGFLLSQRSKNWSFNYWKRNSKPSKILPYPDDLDDTFCVLSAIFGFDQNLLGGEALAKITTLLTAVEAKEGGPYRTWLVPHDADNVWKDIDLAVNSNIAYFLALQDIYLPNLRKFFAEKIANKDFSSKYYPSIFPVIYFLSRYLSLDKKFPVKIRKDFQKFISAAKPKNLLESVLVKSKISPVNSWPAFAFCADPVIDKKKYYAGSPALTTAFYLEALALTSKEIKSKPIKKDKTAGKIYRRVVRLAEKRFSKLPPDLQNEAVKLLGKTIGGDKDKQIILLPYFFALSLREKGKQINDEFPVTLGLANLYGWMAYRIYDDFFDNEGKPAQLSVANMCLRELAAIYNSIFPGRFQKIMDTLDSANAWELAHCRDQSKIPDFGDYSQLANKSIGHALGPLAILHSLGFDENSKAAKRFLLFFQHYLIARQLNDDAHDWEEDLKMNRINAVGAQVLLAAKNNKRQLQEIFWYNVAPKVCRDVLNHVKKARKANVSVFEKILAPIETSAQKAIKERQEALRFLKAY